MSRQNLAKLSRYLYVFVGLAFVYAGWITASRFFENRDIDRRLERTAAARENSRYTGFNHAAGSDVKILQFYASSGVIDEGGKAILCYGVENATSLRLDPPVDNIAPSPNRCIDIAPAQDTRYTLTAQGADGKSVSAAFTLRVKADPFLLPKVTEFATRSSKMEQGRAIALLCYRTENAAFVDIEPHVTPTIYGPTGCFYVALPKTAKYTVVATDRRGRTARKDLTVTVP